jgi:nucleotide-binding universal stress UspA family protein
MYKNILVAVDLSHGDTADHLVKLARHLAGDRGAITLLSVVQPLPSYVGIQAPAGVVDEHRRETEARLKELGGSGVEAITALGSPGSEILALAARLKADAIIVGSHKPGVSDYLIGSTAARVARHANCTVVVDRSALTP